MLTNHRTNRPFESQDCNNHSPAATHRTPAGTVTTLPERGRVVPELQWHGISSIREVFEKPWRILNEMSNREVLIVAVYDGRRRHRASMPLELSPQGLVEMDSADIVRRKHRNQ